MSNSTPVETPVENPVEPPVVIRPLIGGEKARKPLYLEHPDLVEQLRAIPNDDPDRPQKCKLITDEAERRHNLPKKGKHPLTV